MRHLLVTNDFPPKIGGIQSYLWELWRRLPADDVTVYTTPHRDAARFDSEQPFEIRRSTEPWLLPHPPMIPRVQAIAAEVGADAVILDPALPVGRIGPRLGLPYGVILHGAEVTVPGRLLAVRSQLRTVLRGADLVIAAGSYPLAEGERAAGCRLPAIVIPPGVDTTRFAPLPSNRRAEVRRRFGLGAGPVVLSVSRLVPRKGMDSLIEAAHCLHPEFPDLQVVIAGDGRDRRRLEFLARRTAAPVTFLGRVADDELPDLYGCADLFSMLCRNRWRGLEQEGFGIVFVEAGACGLPVVAGTSGGAADAVIDGETGLLLESGDDAQAAAAAMRGLLRDPARRDALGRAGRQRAESVFNYDLLAARLAEALCGPVLGARLDSGPASG